jgi:hypothetical protein
VFVATHPPLPPSCLGHHTCRPARWGAAESTPDDAALPYEREVKALLASTPRHTTAIADEVALDVAIDLGLAFREAWERVPPVGHERVLARARMLMEQRLSGGG